MEIHVCMTTESMDGVKIRSKSFTWGKVNSVKYGFCFEYLSIKILKYHQYNQKHEIKRHQCYAHGPTWNFNHANILRRFWFFTEVKYNKTCTPISLAVDGAWGAWGLWGTCSVTCGGGQRSRTRICDNPTPANGGKNCPGSSGDYGDCNTDACPTVAPGQYNQVNQMVSPTSGKICFVLFICLVFLSICLLALKIVFFECRNYLGLPDLKIEVINMFFVIVSGGVIINFSLN